MNTARVPGIPDSQPMYLLDAHEYCQSARYSGISANKEQKNKVYTSKINMITWGKVIKQEQRVAGIT